MGNDTSKLQPTMSAAAATAAAAAQSNSAKVQRRLSTDSARRFRTSPTLPASNTISGSDGFLSPKSNGSPRISVDGGSPTTGSGRSRSGSASSERSNSIKQQKHPIPTKNRQLIQSCFQNPHEILGRKIIKRTAEKRADFRSFYAPLAAEEKESVENGIKLLLKKAVVNIDFLDEVQRLAEEFGERYVQYRTAGFKADYFAAVADSTITECTFLDNAVHPAHQTLEAFSQFVGIVFTSVRNGFYNEMRRMRRSSHSFTTGQPLAAPRQPRLSFAAADSHHHHQGAMKKFDEMFSPRLLVNGSDPFLRAP